MFGFELVRELRVSLGYRNLHGERDQKKSPSHGFIDVAQERFVIAGEKDLKTGDNRKSRHA